MPRISHFDRNQAFIFRLEDHVSEDNPVRITDAFVDSLDLNSLGFITFASSAPGQQPYSRSDLLKLVLYGYTSGIRSSRKLAAECCRNLELIWLINGITPSKTSIADFIKDNEVPIQNVFKDFVTFLRKYDFVDGNIAVIDGTKIRAQNSRNRYFSTKKIDNIIDYFNSQIEHYTYLLKSDEAEDSSTSDSDNSSLFTFKEKISGYQQKINEFSDLKKKMIDEDISQITLTDPDSRMMTSHGNSDICYNLQHSVDAKNSLIVATDVVSDVNDTNQLQNMHTKTTENLGAPPNVDTADKGYFNTEQIAACEATGTQVFVKRPKSKNSTNNSMFSIDKFSFVPDKNIYICPNNQPLTFSRNLYKRKNPNDSNSSIAGYEYSCSHCATCPYFSQCTTSVDGRRITRNVHQDILDKIQKNFEDNPEMYTIRKCVVEHPFGTIKRSLGYTYFLHRGLKAVRTEAALIAMAYNLIRLSNISKVKEIVKLFRDYSRRFYYFFTIFFQFYKKIINSYSNL